MKILIVEDDPMVRSINVGFVKKINPKYKIVEAQDVNTAMNLLEKEDFDLILLDVYLGKSKGPDLLKWIRETKRTPEVILITADNSAETIQESFMLGAIDYLIKPFNFKRFEEALNKARARKEQLNRKDAFGQEDIDAMVHGGLVKEIYAEKGINGMTYKAVEDALIDAVSPLTAQEVAEITSLARVTVRRYLEHMVETGVAEETLNYGKIGRPQKHYRMRKEG